LVGWLVGWLVGTYIVVKGTATGKLKALFRIWREILLNESNLGTRVIHER
jgi:hypothetical protein